MRGVRSFAAVACLVQKVGPQFQQCSQTGQSR
jgi:hypothetical protein